MGRAWQIPGSARASVWPEYSEVRVTGKKDREAAEETFYSGISQTSVALQTYLTHALGLR